MAVSPTRLLVENALNLTRLANGASAEVRAILRELFDEIVAELSRLDPTQTASDVFARQRVARLVEEVETLAGDAADDMLGLVRQRIAEIGAQQGKVAARVLAHSIGPIEVKVEPGTLGVNLLKKILDRDPVQGELLADAFAEVAHGIAVKFRREVQLGMTANETIADLVRRVRGRSDGRGGFVGGVMDVTTRGAEAYVRTAVMDVSNAALMDTWQENEDLLEGWQFCATLDARTCPQCGPIDGKVFPLDDESNKPPLHMGCRCVSLPVVAWKRLGVSEPKEGTRASADGPVAASTDWQSWFSDQDAATQNDIVGPSRASLFRAGKIDLADLVRTDGRIVTLAELQ